MTHTLRLTLLALLALATAACAPLQGPEVDLAAIAAPEPLPEPPRPPQPPSGPTPGQGAFRAWVPREVTANGDTIEGHWLTISTTPPPVETLQPDTPMPRAPKVLRQKPVQHQAQAPATPGLLPQTPGALQTPGAPQAVLPSGTWRGPVGGPLP